MCVVIIGCSGEFIFDMIQYLNISKCNKVLTS